MYQQIQAVHRHEMSTLWHGHGNKRTHLRLVPNSQVQQECKILGNKVQKQGWTVHWEPVLDGPKGKLKPNLVFMKDEVALVMDPTVIWECDAACLVKASNDKVAKYSCLKSQIKNQFDVKEIQVFRLPVRARGGWTAQNDQVLRALGVPVGGPGTGRHHNAYKPVLRPVSQHH